MKILIILFLAIKLFASDVLEPDKVYEGPLKLTGQRLGLAFYLPLGWQASIDKASQSLVFRNLEDESVIYAKRAERQRVLKEMLMAFKEGESILLPQGDAKKISPHLYRIDYKEKGRVHFKKAIAYIVLGPQKRTVSFLAIFNEADYVKVDTTLMKLVRSVSFTPVQARY